MVRLSKTDSSGLPAPTTVAELYLSAILEELRAIRSLLTPQLDQDDDVVHLREPKPERGVRRRR